MQVARIVAITLSEALEYGVDDRGIDERAVRGHLSHHLGPVGTRPLVMAVEEISRMASEYLESARAADIEQAIIGCLGSDGHHDPRRCSDPLHPFEHAYDERRTAEVQLTLPGRRVEPIRA